MTASSPTRPAAALTVAFAGVVVLAFVGAPQSVNTLLLTGLDSPELAGSQVLIGLAGALGTGLALLLVRRWAVLAVAGGALMAVAYLVHPVVRAGMSAHVVVPGEREEPSDLAANAVWLALAVAGAAVVLIGVLGAAGHLVRAGRRGVGIVVAGLATAAGCSGVLLIDWVPGWLRLPALVAAVLVMAVAAGTGAEQAGPSLPRRLLALAWVAALLPVVPTLTVAITGAATYGSAAGTVVCWVVLLGAVAAAAVAGRALLFGAVGSGLALAAPVPLLMLPVAGATQAPEVWGPALAAAAVSALLVRRWVNVCLLVGALAMAVLHAYLATTGVTGAGDWVVYTLAPLAVVVAVGVGGAVTSGVAGAEWLPAMAPMVTAVAVGARVALNTVQLRPGADELAGMFGAGALWLAAAMLAGGAALLVSYRASARTNSPSLP